MIQLRRLIFLGLVLLGSQLSAGCYLGYTNRAVLFPNLALSPAYARPGTAGGYGCGPSCYREFGPGSGACGGSLLGGPFAGGPIAGGPVVTGPVYDAPVTVLPPAGVPVGFGYGPAVGTPGCTSCGTGGSYPVGGAPIPIASGPGGPPIATSPPSGYMPPGFVPTGGPIHVGPFDSGIVPTVKPPVGSVPLQMPNEVKESKKIVATGK
jgi:hypothetical protein